MKKFFAVSLAAVLSFSGITANANIASWYGPGFHGKLTANGETFNQNAMTAAHKTLTFGSKVKVTNQNNGRSTIVCINDRGPYVKGRVIDLSKAAAREIGIQGIAPVKLEVIHKPTSWRYGRKVC